MGKSMYFYWFGNKLLQSLMVEDRILQEGGRLKVNPSNYIFHKVIIFKLIFIHFMYSGWPQ